MGKFKLKKPSKRMQAAKRYKIEKKVREHNRKVKKEKAKKERRQKKQIITIPNECPFKESILKDIEEYKKHKQMLKEEAKKERQAQKEESKKESKNEEQTQSEK